MPEWEVTDAITGVVTVVESAVEPASVWLRRALQDMRPHTNVGLVRGAVRNPRSGRYDHTLLTGDGTRRVPYRCLVTGDDIDAIRRLIEHYQLNLVWED